jgi:putative ABC transport system permease protein
MLGEALARSLKATPGSSLTLLASTTEGAMNAMDVRGQGHLHHRRARHGQARWFTPAWPLAQRLLVTDRVSSLGVFLDRMASTLPAQARVAAN